MNTLNFDNIAFVFSFFCGLCFGLWIGFIFKAHSDNKYIKSIQELERKNQKLIYFIRYKLKHFTPDDDKEVNNIEI